MAAKITAYEWNNNIKLHAKCAFLQQKWRKGWKETSIEIVSLFEISYFLSKKNNAGLVFETIGTHFYFFIILSLQSPINTLTKTAEHFLIRKNWDWLAPFFFVIKKEKLSGIGTASTKY